MKSTLIPLVLAVALTLAAPAGAQDADCGPDCVGLYFTLLHGRTSCSVGASPRNAEAYVILTSPTMEAISFMSFAVVTEGPVIVTDVSFGGTQICEPVEPGAYCHFWDPPVATATETTLAVIRLFYAGTGEPAFIGLRNSGAIADDRPWVTLPDGTEMPLNPSAGPGQPMAQMGGVCEVVPVATRSWSAVRSMYR